MYRIYSVLQESKNTYLHVEGQSSSLEELIRGCSRNERGAQEAMYKQFYGRMMGVVRRYIDYPEQAEEVLNNGFLRAFQKIEQYTYKGSFEGWLRKIVFHAVADYVKQHAKYNTQIILVEKDQLIKKDLADNLYYDQLLALIQTLPSSTRNVFNMYVLDGYPHKEIADILGISEGTSKWHLSEGRRILREKIEKLNLHIK